MLLVDAANVIGSRPTGWWKDRAGAARSFVGDLRAGVEAGQLTEPVDVVGDASAASTEEIMLVTADRELRRRVEALGAEVVGPKWLLERLD
jgi:hypothetical protein